MGNPATEPAGPFQGVDPLEGTDAAAAKPSPTEGSGSFVPQRGLKIGASLAICISVVLVVVLGGLSAIQLRREARQEQAARQSLLAQSLAPLAAEIAQASSSDHIGDLLRAYRQAFVTRGHPDHLAALYDANGQLIVGPEPGLERPPQSALSASIEVVGPAVPGDSAILTVWQDGSELTLELARRRRLAWFDICATILVLWFGVQIVVHFLVSRPLRQLLISIEKTENGYVHTFPNTPGAREIRQLALSFHKMSRELTEGARLLVGAQRRAAALATKRRVAPVSRTTPSIPIDGPDKPTAGESILRRYLNDRCVFLESSEPGDPFNRGYAIEAWEQDVVEAERLGDLDLKARLGNAALRVLEPEAYENVGRAVDDLRRRRVTWCVEVEDQLSKALEASGVHCITIQHRFKHVAGVWRKMQEKHLAIDEVHDLLAFRAVVPDRDDCYLALDAVHRLYEPEPFRFKDYIERPKSNGYQSLHTTVRDDGGFPFEVQIRTVEMHEAAENGDASHWKYLAKKNGKEPTSGKRRRNPWTGRIPFFSRFFHTVF